jgi:DNA-binding transcriptional LysR family regulator
MVAKKITIASDGESEVIQDSEQDVQNFEPPTLTELLQRVHQDDLNLMRCIGEASSLRKVSAQLKLSANTARARLRRLETTIGAILYTRDWQGLRVTAAGRAVLNVANEIHRLTNVLPQARGNNILVRDGEIRLCVSEGIGTFWLTPRLMELKRKLPELVVSLDCFADQSRVNPNDFDIVIGFSRPEDQQAIVTKLATVHMMPFASEQYLQSFGTPENLSELNGHQCVQQESPGMNYDAIRFFVGSETLKNFVSIKVSSSYSLFWAIASGAGVGALPTYARAISQRVRPLDLPIQMQFELWGSFRRSSKESKPVRAALDWLRASFDSNRYPWFADKFVHPNDFAVAYEDSQIVPLFDHLIDELS